MFMNKRRIISLFVILLSIHSLVFAEDGSYNLLARFLQGILNALSWAGLAIAVRNDDIYRYKVCNEWGK